MECRKSGLSWYMQVERTQSVLKGGYICPLESRRMYAHGDWCLSCLKILETRGWWHLPVVKGRKGGSWQRRLDC